MCNDRLPDDYGNGCNWSCENWALGGYCDRYWSDFTCGTSFGKIKDNCKSSCNYCGKYFKIDIAQEKDTIK